MEKEGDLVYLKVIMLKHTKNYSLGKMLMTRKWVQNVDIKRFDGFKGGS